MEFIKGISRLRRKLQDSVVALGTFDGVHRGHQQVIRTTREIARREGRKSVVVTFEPLPRAVVGERREPMRLITTLEAKEKIIENMGIDALLVIHFSRKLAQVDPEEFVRKIVCGKIGAGRVVVGPGFRFGRNRRGNVRLLKKLGSKYGFGVTIVGEVKTGNSKVSSSKIRQLLHQGRIEEANRFLGRYYTVSGVVRRGSGRGKEVCFPTANLDIPVNVVLPKGVYAVLIIFRGRKRLGTANIGIRPTFTPGPGLRFQKLTGGLVRPLVEVYIFNFRGNLYRRKLQVALMKKIRKEMRFPSVEKLKEQIKKDIQFTKELKPISRYLTKLR